MKAAALSVHTFLDIKIYMDFVITFTVHNELKDRRL